MALDRSPDFFEIALANFFFFCRFQRRIYKNFSLSAQYKKPSSLIPCLLTVQNFKNSSEKGHSRNISMRLFQNLTNSFREDFLMILCMFI